MNRKSKRQRVLDALSGNEWVPGYDLAAPGVGGSEGLRRLRELREMGYEIEKRKMGDNDAYEYHLIGRVKA